MTDTPSTDAPAAETPPDAAPRPDEGLLAQLGARVRMARQKRGLARRVLSEMSGVSPRYLAQLEGGTGNISVALLHRVAQALDLPLEQLLHDGTRDGDDLPEDAHRVATLYARAAPEQRAQVRALLDGAAPAAARAGRICLVGLRGAGKSTLGRMASAALNVPFVELNAEVARRAGMPVAEIMALYGQEVYRAREREALDAVIAGHSRLVLAVGGGLVLEEATYARLLSAFHCVWVRAAPEDHMARVRAQGDLRPMEGHPEAMTQLRAILQARAPLYGRAHAVLDTEDASPEESRAALLALIADSGFLEKGDSA